MTTLLPEDIPGAILKDGVSLEDHSLSELKRWLECRGLKRSGTKGELITRIQNCIEANNDSKIFPGVDGGKWYDAKKNANQSLGHSNQPGRRISQFRWDDVTWGTFPSTDIPIFFNKGHIYNYIMAENIETEDPETFEIEEDEPITTVKPFRKGHQFVNSQHVSKIEDGLLGTIYACKCLCLSSFQKTLKYKVCVSINNRSGGVISGQCECKQSSLGKCSHVTALLLFIWEYVEKFGNSQVAGTSKPREWGLGTQKRKPSCIKNVDYGLKKCKLSRSTYDPRPKDYIRDPNINSFIVNLQKVGLDDNFQRILKIKYENFHYAPEEMIVLKLQSVIRQNTMRRYANGFESTIFHIPHTFPQGTEEWFRWRTYYITSSNTKLVTNQLHSDSAKQTFLLKNLWRMTPPISTIATRYGKNNEGKARTEYSRLFLKNNQKMVEFGLTVNKKYPFFATSVDGCVYEDKKVTHLIEIKCPKILENCVRLDEFEKFLTTSQLSNFFLRKYDGKIILKRNHPYLYQILMSLIIFEVEICHLIVWCPKSLLVVPVCRKDHLETIEEIKKKAKHFYCNIYVPEMITMRTVRDLFPVDIKMYE